LSSKAYLQGAHFFYENGTQFFIRGIEYHDYHKISPSDSTYIDLLALNSVCFRDLPHLRRLGINTLFVSNTDPQKPHAGCMRLFQDAGIYVMVTPFNRNGISTESLPTWDNGTFPFDYRLWEYGFHHVDAFVQYPNTLGFTVPLADHTTDLVRQIPWNKAMVRDLKEYIRSKGYRNVPVGAATYQYDVSAIPQYMNCGEQSSSADFLGLDLTDVGEKRQCGNISAWFESGVPENYRDYSLPTYLLYGCPVDIRKDFKEIETTFNDVWSETFSGVVTFGYLNNSASPKDYGEALCLLQLTKRAHPVPGVVELHEDQQVAPRPLYASLASELAAATPKSMDKASYTPTNKSPLICQNFSSPAYDVKNNSYVLMRIATTLPSKPSRRVCSCMMDTLSCAATVDDRRLPVNSLDEEDLCRNHVEWCGAVPGEESDGIYDSFRGCTPLERSSWAINQKYLAGGGSNASECNSLGGVTQTPIPSASQASDCQIFLEQAGPSGTGTITSTPGASSSGTLVKTAEGLAIKAPEGGLAGGVKGAIAGAIISFFILVFSAVLFLRFRKRKGANVQPPSPPMDGKWQKAELEHIPVVASPGAIEQLDGNAVHELEGDPGEGRVVEIDGDAIQAELEANPRNPELDSGTALAEREDETTNSEPRERTG
jgi:hypothetical protein